jgi:hypothetical protein
MDSTVQIFDALSIVLFPLRDTILMDQMSILMTADISHERLDIVNL